MEQSEAKIQSDSFIWHWNHFPEERGLLHANNNNSFNAVKGNQNKAMGVVRGVADTEYCKNGQLIFIEFKTRSGTQSEDQKIFQARVEEQGFRYVIIRSLVEFKQLIEQYQKKI